MWVHTALGSGLTSGVHDVLFGCRKAQRLLGSVPENIQKHGFLLLPASSPRCVLFVHLVSDNRRLLCIHPLTLTAAVLTKKVKSGGP